MLWLIAIFIASNRIFTEGICKLCDLIISDLIDEDYVVNDRKVRYWSASYNCDLAYVNYFLIDNLEKILQRCDSQFYISDNSIFVRFRQCCTSDETRSNSRSSYWDFPTHKTRSSQFSRGFRFWNWKIGKHILLSSLRILFAACCSLWAWWVLLFIL